MLELLENFQAGSTILAMIALREWLQSGGDGEGRRPHNVQIPDLVRQVLADVLALDAKEIADDSLLGRDLDFWHADALDFSFKLGRKMNMDFELADLTEQLPDPDSAGELTPELFRRQDSLAALLKGRPKDTENGVYLGEHVDRLLQMRVDQLIAAVISKTRLK